MRRCRRRRTGVIGPISQLDVGDQCGFDRSDMVAILKDLEARRVVARRSDPTDGRRNLVSIAGAGRRQRRRLDMVLASIQDELLAPRSKAERRELTRLLQRVLDHYRPKLPVYVNRHPGVPSTIRNWNTTTKLLELVSS